MVNQWCWDAAYKATLFFPTLAAPVPSPFMDRMGMPCPAQYNPADHFINQLSVEPGYRSACRLHIHAVCDAFEQSNVGKAILEDVTTNEIFQNYQVL